MPLTLEAGQLKAVVLLRVKAFIYILAYENVIEKFDLATPDERPLVELAGHLSAAQRQIAQNV